MSLSSHGLDGGGKADDDQASLLQYAGRVVSLEVDDGDNLAPITGLNKAMVQTAAICVKHIIDTSPEFAAKVEAEGGWKMRIKAAEMFARKIVCKPERNPHKLLSCFVVAIHLYTQEWALYKELNACLRSRDRKKLLPFFPYLRLLLTALSCIPPSAITVFRGVKKDLTGKFVKGEQAVWWSVTSTTTSMGTLQEEMFLGKTGKRTMFCIAAKTFRDVRNYSAIGLEAECCGLPGTCFDIDDLLDQVDLQIVQMSENVDDCMLDFAPDVAAYAVLEASGASAGATVTPAVFSTSQSSSSAAFSKPYTAPVSSSSAAATRPLSELAAQDVALIVCCRGEAFEGYSPAIMSNSFGGDVIDMLDIDDIAQLMESMGFATNHKLVLKATFAGWKKNPDAAFEALAAAKVSLRFQQPLLFTA